MAPVPNVHEGAHTAYVDNFLAFDTEKELAEAKVSAVMAELTRMGLEVQRDDPYANGPSAEVLGWRIRRRPAAVGPKPERLEGEACRARRVDPWQDARSRLGEAPRAPLVLVPHPAREPLRLRAHVLVRAAALLEGGAAVAERAPGVGALGRHRAASHGGPDLALVPAGVYMVDASLWGMGACRAEFPVEEVKSLGQISERWRFKMPSAPGAPSPSQPRRFAAFGSGKTVAPAPPPASESEHAGEIGPFERRPQAEWSGVRRSVMEKEWQVVGRCAWERTQGMPVLEARSALYGLRHAIRSGQSFGTRQVILGGSLSAGYGTRCPRAGAQRTRWVAWRSRSEVFCWLANVCIHYRCVCGCPVSGTRPTTRPDPRWPEPAAPP